MELGTRGNTESDGVESSMEQELYQVTMVESGLTCFQCNIPESFRLSSSVLCPLLRKDG